MKVKKNVAPARIYLQYYAGCPDEKTWCEDKINSNDVEYVRADLHRKTVKQLRKAILFLRGTIGDINGSEGK